MWTHWCAKFLFLVGNRNWKMSRDCCCILLFRILAYRFAGKRRSRYWTAGCVGIVWLVKVTVSIDDFAEACVCVFRNGRFIVVLTFRLITDAGEMRFLVTRNLSWTHGLFLAADKTLKDWEVGVSKLGWFSTISTLRHVCLICCYLWKGRERCNAIHWTGGLDQFFVWGVKFQCDMCSMAMPK